MIVHLTFGRACAAGLTSMLFLLLPANAHALFVVPPGGGGFNNLGGGGLNLGGAGGGGQQQTPQIQRATNTLSNPVNFWQYSQVTGVKPTIGTVRIYNQFGTLAGQNGSANQQQGGFGGGFGLGGGGGFGGGGMGAQLPGVGTSSGGDDPPQGVLLSVNYANMFFPNQTQLNQTNQGQGGGFGGVGIGGLGGGFGGGFNGGFGKGGFGNGGAGL